MNNYRQQDGFHCCKQALLNHPDEGAWGFCSIFNEKNVDELNRNRVIAREGICDDFEKVEGEENDDS